MTDIYLRPGKILHSFSRLYADTWKQVDEFRARKKELRDWPEWCFLPLAGPTCHPPSSPGRHSRSLSQPGGDGGDAPALCTHIRRAHWHSFWVGERDEPDARFVTLKWLPPIPVNVQGVDDLTTTVRDVGSSD